MHEVLFALMQLRDKLIKEYHHPGFAIPSPTLNLGHIHGGDSANRICGCCELHYDVRPLPGISLDGLDNMLRNALKEVEAKWPGELRSLRCTSRFRVMSVSMIIHLLVAWSRYVKPSHKP